MGLPFGIERHQEALAVFDYESFERNLIPIFEADHDICAVRRFNIRVYENEFAVLVNGFHGGTVNLQRECVGPALSRAYQPNFGIPRLKGVYAFCKCSCLDPGYEGHTNGPFNRFARNPIGKALCRTPRLLEEWGEVDPERIGYESLSFGLWIDLSPKQATDRRLRYARFLAHCLLCLQVVTGRHRGLHCRGECLSEGCFRSVLPLSHMWIIIELFSHKGLNAYA